MTPLGALPTPTNPQILGQRIQILKFRRKHMKVHRIAAIYVQTGKNPDSDLWPPLSP